VLTQGPTLKVETLWLAGGLYGNPCALDTLIELFEREPGSKALVFNGDFHWFDTRSRGLFAHQRCGPGFVAMRGNVETELVLPDARAGCGCSYPDWVDDATVLALEPHHSSGCAPTASPLAGVERLAKLRCILWPRSAATRVAVVHGDAESLAGWGFSQEALATASGFAAALDAFESTGVRILRLQPHLPAGAAMLRWRQGLGQ